MNAHGDSDFLAQRDKTVHDFRASDKDTKLKIIEKMLTLRHNMKYNKHLLSVYTKAKSLFDTMIEEHRSESYYSGKSLVSAEERGDECDDGRTCQR